MVSEDRRALGVQPADVAPQLQAQLVVHAGGGLVEDHQPRAVHERSGEQQPAALAAGELRRAHVALGAEVEDLDHLVGALVRLGLLHPEVAAVVDQRLAHREEAVEVHVLLREPDPAARQQRLGRLAEHRDLAAVTRIRLQIALIARRLAGAVGAEQAEEGAVGHGEVEVLDRERAVVVALREGADVERGGVAVHRIEANE